MKQIFIALAILAFGHSQGQQKHPAFMEQGNIKFL